MMFRHWNQQGNQHHEINVTPLIDVSLVLVVMLLLATPLAFESSIDVRNQQVAARKAAKQEQSERIVLTVVSEDSVRVNRKIVPRANLAAVLAPMISTAVDHSVSVDCAPRVTNGAFVNVIDQAKLAGATQIAVVER